MTRVVFFTVEKSLVLPDELLDKPSSGTVVALVNLASELARAGDYVTVAGCRQQQVTPNLDYVECVRDDALATLCENLRVDHLVIVGHAIHAISAHVAQQFDCIYWMHNWENLQESKVAAVINVCRRIVCVSRYHFSYYFLKHLLRPTIRNRLTYINNALHPIPIPRSPHNPEKIESAQPSLKLAFVGYPSDVKGFGLVVEVAQQVRNLLSIDVQLHVFGGKNLYDPANTTEEPAPEQSAWLVRHGTVTRRELYEKLPACDYILAGLNGSETFCLAALEALACGVVPVTVSTGGQTSFLNKKNSVIAADVRALPSIIVRHASVDLIHTRREIDQLALEILHTFSPAKVAVRWKTNMSSRSSGEPLSSTVLAVVWFAYFRVRHKLCGIVPGR